MIYYIKLYVYRLFNLFYFYFFNHDFYYIFIIFNDYGEDHFLSNFNLFLLLRNIISSKI